MVSTWTTTSILPYDTKFWWCRFNNSTQNLADNILANASCHSAYSPNLKLEYFGKWTLTCQIKIFALYGTQQHSIAVL